MAKMTRAELRRRKRRRKKIRKYAILTGFAVILILLVLLLIKLISWIFSGSDDGLVKKVDNIPVTQKLLTIDINTRPGTTLEKVEKIVIHYTAREVGSTAMAQRDRYEALRDTRNETDTRESMHFIIGSEGEIVQCIPINEAAYASKGDNGRALSIEFCNTTAEGGMSRETYVSLVKLVAYLCDEFDLTEKNVERHYDITGGACPRYFVKNPDSWTQFRDDVAKAIQGKSFDTSNPIVVQ
ncbi:MAG: N-acetylmuramoyl-L-alanine amidase [Lachnospiraceae bacterium]|jgi:N-acetylmuramoyl-L-alanine amidase CwlA|nr:N-acetylmuramoyl-L-alanine amidase [Lachnospiraceae bacterium]